MLVWLLLLFVAVPLTEILVISWATDLIGGQNTLLLLILFSAAGAWLVKYEGIATARRVRSGLQAGRMPTSDVIDGLVVLVAGVLLLTPGFVTTGVGLVMLFPPVRALIRAGLGASLSRRVARQVRAAGFATGTGPSSAGWQPGWTTPNGPGQARRTATGDPDPRTDAGPRSGFRRPYRRPDEPDPAAARVWGARVRDPHQGADDVIDIDGEEIVFGDSGPELGPSR